MEKVFIGMPVYNGERYLSTAIDSIRKQTFTDWVLLISDNASTDRTEEICKHYCSVDHRVRYIKQKKNLGVANFKFLLDNANLEYFMWAAHDDVWMPEFLNFMLNLLKGQNCSMAFCNVVMVDSFGKEIRKLPSFSKFTTRYRLLNILRFLFDPEVFGKANLIYSVYRLNDCRSAHRRNPLSDHWGSDVCFVLSILSRSKLTIKNKVLFQKRQVRITDKLGKIDKIKIKAPCLHVFPIKYSVSYIKSSLSAVKGTKFYLVVLIVMFLRIPISIFKWTLDSVVSIIKKIQ